MPPWFRGASSNHDAAPDLRPIDSLPAEGHVREGRDPPPLGQAREADHGLIRMLDRMLAGRTGLSPVMVGRTSPLSRLTGLMATVSTRACRRTGGRRGRCRKDPAAPRAGPVASPRGAGARRPGRARVTRSSLRARARRTRSRRSPRHARPPGSGRAGLPRPRGQRSCGDHLRGPALGRCREPRGVRAPRVGHAARHDAHRFVPVRRAQPLPACGRSARASRSQAHRASPVARPARPSRRSRTSSHASTGDRCRRRRPTPSTRARGATRSSSRRS